ncbi:MAG: hypothetical protein QOI41_7442, partial [Myxococcales bacterium]|nr:hypothetical protein [Myxococcales bacterium]
MTEPRDRAADEMQIARIEQELTPGMGRRAFLGTAAAAAATATLVSKDAFAGPAPKSLAASPPPGFSPFAAPGKVVKVTKKDCLQANQLYPKPDAAKEMLTRAMMELTGKPDLVTAMQQFVHKDDIVCVKVNGIAKQNMGTNKELVLPFLEALIAAGVPAGNITVLEQYGDFLAGTRINASNVPAGVKVSLHNNGNATMDYRLIPGTGTSTKFTKYLTEATAAFNFALIK